GGNWAADGRGVRAFATCGLPQNGAQGIGSRLTGYPRGTRAKGRGGEMYRKHTRRTAKAAFAVSLGVALLIGITAFGGSAKGSVAGAQKAQSKPHLVIGTKNFPEEFILGQLYGQALAAKGFKVTYKNDIGSSEVIDTAIRSKQIN